MSDVKVTAKMNGPGVDDGGIKLTQFIQFSETFQKLLYQVAHVHSSEKDAIYNMVSRPETALRVIAIEKGSFNLGFTLQRNAPSFLMIDPGLIALNKLFDGIQVISKNEHFSRLPSGYNQSVLALLRQLGLDLLDKGINEIYFEFQITGGIIKKFVYDTNLYSVITRYIAEPKEQKKVLQGHFWRVNFQPDSRHVWLHLSNNSNVKCTFDDTLAAKVQEAMQHRVRVWGLAIIEPTTDEIKELELKGLTILDIPRNVKPKYETSDELTEYILTKNAELYRRLAQ